MAALPNSQNDGSIVVVSDHGMVLLHGPREVLLVLTPDEAERTARFLAAAAKRARFETSKGR
jgi:hypothetical protein